MAIKNHLFVCFSHFQGTGLVDVTTSDDCGENAAEHGQEVVAEEANRDAAVARMQQKSL